MQGCSEARGVDGQSLGETDATNRWCCHSCRAARRNADRRSKYSDRAGAKAIRVWQTPSRYPQLSYVGPRMVPRETPAQRRSSDSPTACRASVRPPDSRCSDPRMSLCSHCAPAHDRVSLPVTHARACFHNSGSPVNAHATADRDALKPAAAIPTVTKTATHSFSFQADSTPLVPINPRYWSPPSRDRHAKGQVVVHIEQFRKHERAAFAYLSLKHIGGCL